MAGGKLVLNSFLPFHLGALCVTFALLDHLIYFTESKSLLSSARIFLVSHDMLSLYFSILKVEGKWPQKVTNFDISIGSGDHDATPKRRHVTGGDGTSS